MNDLTKFGLAAGMAILLVLGTIFKNVPGGQGAGLRQDLAESEKTVASLRTELAQASDGNDKAVASLRTEMGQVSESRDSLSKALEIANTELAQLKQKPQPDADELEDSQRKVATLQLEVDGLRDKLTASEATSQEMIAGLNARLRARVTESNDSVEMQNEMQGLRAKVSQVDAQLEDAAQSNTSFKEQLALLITERDGLTGQLARASLQVEQQEKSLVDLQAEADQAERDLQIVSANLEGVSTERDALLGRVAELKQSTNDMQGTSDSLTDKTRELESQALVLQTQSSDLEVARDGLQTKLDATTAELKSARSEIETLTTEQIQLNDALAAAKVQRDTLVPVTTDESADLIAALSNRFAVAGIDGVKIYKRSGGIVSVRAGNSEVFSPGGTAISAEGREILAEVGSVMAARPDSRLQIEGHTDNIPIGSVMSGLYGSNWDLSVARAMAAVRHLERRVGLGADRLSGAGFGEFMPVATNDTAEGRSLNRRIEIVVYPVEQTPN